MLMPSRVRLLLTGHPELTAVLAAAVLGLSVQPPLAWLASRPGINVLLAILAFATAVTIEPAALRSLTRSWPSLLAALAAGSPCSRRCHGPSPRSSPPSRSATAS